MDNWNWDVFKTDPKTKRKRFTKNSFRIFASAFCYLVAILVAYFEYGWSMVLVLFLWFLAYTILGQAE